MATQALPIQHIFAGDAVMAFVGMLTSLPYVVPFGAAAWATPGVRLAAAFNEANGLEVSGDFPDGLIFPKIEGPLLATVTSAAQSEKAQEQMTPLDAACQILARAPAQYTYWEKRVWREGFISGTRIATKPLERELAINLARQSALAHRSQHDYLPQSPEAAATWQPHAWVVLAIQAASIGTSAVPGIDLTEVPRYVLAHDDHVSEMRESERGAWVRLCDVEYVLSAASPKGATLNEQFGSAEGLGTSEVLRVADHMAQVIDYIGKRYPDATMLDRGPILRNIRRWERDLRAVLADSPKGSSEARDAATSWLIEAAQAARQCIAELKPTQARAEVAQMLTAAIEAALRATSAEVGE